MNQEKISKFFLTAIEKTKAGTLTWRRGLSSREYGNLLKPRDRIDDWRSFVSNYEEATIVLLTEEYTDSISCCLLVANTGLPFQQIGDENDPALLRLYNVVYSQFPSIDLFIDSFIADSENTNDHE